MLFKLYGKDIRSVRVLNLMVHIIWTYLIIAHLSGYVQVNLAGNTEPKFILILTLCVLTLLVTSFTFVESKYKVKLKYFSLTLGSLVQTLIAIKFGTKYPPFDVMVIVCSLLALWFVGGALYIKQITDMENTNVNGVS